MSSAEIKSDPENAEETLEAVYSRFYLPVVRFSPSLEAQEIVRSAESGDLEATVGILKGLVLYLESNVELAEEFATFCGEAFIKFSKFPILAAAAEEFESMLLKYIKVPSWKYSEVCTGAFSQFVRLSYLASRRHKFEKVRRVRKLISARIAELSAKFLQQVGLRLKEKFCRRLGAAFTTAIHLQKKNRPRLTGRPSALSGSFCDLEIVQGLYIRHPRAFQIAFERLGQHLLGQSEFPRSFLWIDPNPCPAGPGVCALSDVGLVESFKAFLDSDELLELLIKARKPEPSTRQRHASKADEVGDLRKIQRAFCRSFGLSADKRVELPYGPMIGGHWMTMIYCLLEAGVTEKRAIQIVRSGGKVCPQPKTLTNWLSYDRRKARKLHDRVEAKPKRVKGKSRPLIYHVWKALREPECTLKSAFLVAGREFVREEISLPRATEFVEPDTVRAVWNLYLQSFEQPGHPLRSYYWPDSERANEVQYRVAKELQSGCTLAQAEKRVAESQDTPTAG